MSHIVQRRSDYKVVSDAVDLAEAVRVAQAKSLDLKKSHVISYKSGAPVAYVNKLGEVTWHKQNDRELQA